MASMSTNAFNPTVGKCYEVHFGQITLQGQTGFWSAKIRVNGSHFSQWIDLDTGLPIDPHLAVYVVQAHSEIACPP